MRAENHLGFIFFQVEFNMLFMDTLLANILILQLFSLPLSILAYIDPGTGSIVLQALIAAVVGAAIAVKLFWHRLLKFFGLRKGELPDSGENNENLTRKP